MVTSRSATLEQQKAAALAHELEQLRDEMRLRHRESGATFEQVHPLHRQSAANLVDYLTLRNHDLRALQDSLAELGLSSLGRSEEHVLTTLERVLGTLHLLAGETNRPRTEAAVGFEGGRESLEANAEALLGQNPKGRSTRILVTMPTEAAYDARLCRDLIANGMDCARINCAHDDVVQWTSMVANLRQAAVSAGRECPILMDLPGPKLRTGPVEDGPGVVRLRPRRDPFGRPVEAAKAELVAEDDFKSPYKSADGVAELPVAGAWLASLRTGEKIHLRDTRHCARTLLVTRAAPMRAWVEATDTTYLTGGTPLDAAGRTAVVGRLPPVEQALILRPGDVLTVSADLSPAPVTAQNTRPLRIGCTLPEVLAKQHVGDRVFFDDGKIGGNVVGIRPREIDVRISIAAPRGSKLRAAKGINFPDADLDLPAFTEEDEPILRFIAENADLMGISFAQDPADIVELRHSLGDLGGSGLGMVLKVETKRGFEHLPELLLTAMASQRLGVMVARGDLAVECGFERLAELQEEILCLCDAAHVPLIWATQVLDQMARTGLPSRAEISDAAMAERAECVMLNKGPHITEAVGALDDILCRMSSHQRKKVALLRRLSAWSP